MPPGAAVSTVVLVLVVSPAVPVVVEVPAVSLVVEVPAVDDACPIEESLAVPEATALLPSLASFESELQAARTDTAMGSTQHTPTLRNEYRV